MGDGWLDVPTNSKLYEFTQIQLAQKYLQDLSQRASISVRSIDGLPTEGRIERCAQKSLARESGKGVLRATADYHTRRALSVFRREVPGMFTRQLLRGTQRHFDATGWTHGQGAKIFVDEWLRLVWWKLGNHRPEKIYSRPCFSLQTTL
jgi:hypothetical protein